MSAPWYEEEIAGAVGPLLPNLAVEVVEEIDSTSSELMRRARDGRAHPVLLVAQRQTAGRGRMGRAWESAQDKDEPASLTFSLGLPLMPRDWSGLSLAVGVSVAESLDASNPPRIGLKWPNDLWFEERKLGGILIETALPQDGMAQRYLVIGIGINIGPREATGMSTAPAWIREWRPDATAPGLLREIVPPLVAHVLLFGDRGFVPFAERFAARDVLRGRDVQLSDGTAGHCAGVGWGGELLVQTSSGTKTVVSAEVSVRPAPSSG